MTKGTPQRIFLTGFSGTGKSSIARLVAKELGWRAVDTDKLIEEAAGRPVTQIFARDGEEAFRALERQALAKASREERVVVATGGGAPVTRANRKSMAGGLVVCLSAQPETIAKRLSKDASERPLLAGGDPLERIRTLKAQRYRFYALADAVVDVDRRTRAQVVADVIDALQRSDPGKPDRLLLPEEHTPRPSGRPVAVKAASRRYQVHVGWGALDRLGELMRRAGLDGTAYVISDSEVLPRHGDLALASLREAGFEADAFAVPAGEAHKRLETAATVYDWLVSKRAERGHTVVALGGGVIGDMAGFVAATYLRGMAVVQAPTSMLAMVDASVGGKTGVDHREGKNLIGAFHQPRLVLSDISTLKTLPRRLLVEGCAEAIKHALILDPQLLDDMESRADELLALEPAVTQDIVRRNVAIKASVVSEDELDAGRRAILNYGHTVAHAIEAAADYTIGHGAADAVGMMAAAEIGRRLGVTPQRVIDRQRAVFKRYGLSTRAPGLDAGAVLDAMALDKKMQAGSIRWVLLEDVGRAVLRHDVPAKLVREVVRKVLR